MAECHPVGFQWVMEAKARRAWTRASGRTWAPIWSACSRPGGAGRPRPDNDFCYDYLPRLTGSHSTYETVAAQIAGDCPGYFLFGENPAVGSANGRMQRFGLASPGLAGGPRPGPDRERHVLAERPGDRDRGDAHRGHRYRGVLPARRRAHREERLVHQHPADAAVAPRGGRAGRGRAQRPVVRLPSRPQDPGEARRLRPTRWTGRCRTSPGTTRSKGRWPSRPPRRYWPRSTAGTRKGKPLSSYTQLTGRRVDRLRLLDLLRRPRRRREPGRAAQARIRAELGRPGVGLGLAGQPADPVQPRLGRPGRHAVERAQGAGLVGRGRGHVDRARRGRLRRRPGAVLPAARRRHRASTRSPAWTRSSCRPTARAGCSPRPGWWTARCPRTTSRRSPRSPTRCTASSATRSAEIIRHPRNPLQPSGREPGSDVFPYVLTTYRLTEHHTAGGMCAHAALPVGAAAGVLLRGLAGSPPSGAGAPGLGHDRHGADRDRGAGPGHRADPRRCGAAHRLAPDRAAVPLGGQRLSRRRLANDLAHVTLDPNVHIQEVKAAACDIRPGRRPRGPALRRGWCDDYRRRAGISDDDRATRCMARWTTGRRRGLRRPPAADGLLHRHLGLHRLQGLRGGVQGVERGARRRAQPVRDVLRQHRRASGACTWRHVAFIEQTVPSRTTTVRPGPPAAGEGDATEVRWLMSSRRVQALHPRRLPRRLPDRGAVPHRVRHRRRPARHLQRLRLLRAGLPLRRDRPAQRRTARALQVHALLRPAQGRPEAGLCPGLPDRVHPVRPARRAARAGPAPASGDAARAGRGPWPGSTGADPDDGVGGDGAFFLLLDEPEVYGLPPDPVVTTRDLPACGSTSASPRPGLAASAVALALGRRR